MNRIKKNGHPGLRWCPKTSRRELRSFQLDNNSKEATEQAEHARLRELHQLDGPTWAQWDLERLGTSERYLEALLFFQQMNRHIAAQGLKPDVKRMLKEDRAPVIFAMAQSEQQPQGATSFRPLNPDGSDPEPPYEPKGDSPVGYLQTGISYSDILVGNGFLERGSGILIAGPSGIGKSSIAMQTGCYWACGQSAFDLLASGSLRIVMMQHEDSRNDLFRMSELVRWSGLRSDVIQQNFWIETVRGAIGMRAIAIMRDLVKWHRADVLILNPLTAYHDGNISENRDNVKFLYGELGGLLDELRIGLVAFHHKGKPPRDGKNNREDVEHEIMYEVLGGSILTNFFRGIVAVSPIPNSGIYKFTVAKRFQESGWPTRTQHYKWHEDHSRRLWVPASVVEADAARKIVGKTLEDLRKLVPLTGSVARETLENDAATAGFRRREYRGLIEEAQADTTPDDLRIHKWSVYNPAGLAKVAFSRFEQPPDETHQAIRDANKAARKAERKSS